MIKLSLDRHKLEKEIKNDYNMILEKGSDSFEKLNELNTHTPALKEAIAANNVNQTLSTILTDYSIKYPINTSGLENLYDTHADLQVANQNLYFENLEKQGQTFSKFQKFKIKLINRDNWVSLKAKSINSFFYYNTYHQFRLIKTAKMYGYTSGVFGFMPYFALSTAASGVFYIAEFYAPVGKVKHLLHAGYLLTSAPNVAMLGCTNLVFRGIEKYISGSSLPASAGELLGLAPADVKANQWIYNKISKITGSAVYKKTAGKIQYIIKNWHEIPDVK